MFNSPNIVFKFKKTLPNKKRIQWIDKICVTLPQKVDFHLMKEY